MPDEYTQTVPSGQAAAIFQSIHRRGVRPMTHGDHRSICKVCELVAAGQLPEALVMSAAEAVLHCHPYKPIGYFFTVLHEECKQRGLYLYNLLPPQSANASAHVARAGHTENREVP